MMRYRLDAPAKINPFLEILGKRDDGYHNVHFVMQTVDLCDTLTLTVNEPGAGLTLTCSDPELETDDNLVRQAYFLFYESLPSITPYEVAVDLVKRIPVQAGLGGGSSDAAAMLRLLNHHHQYPLDTLALSQLGAALGSDIPFFLYGGTCEATGRGERIKPLEAQYPNQRVLLVKPTQLGISTPKAYGLVKTGVYELENPENNRLFNRFETVLFDAYPVLKTIQKKLEACFRAPCLLSGSGPTFFVFLADETNVSRYWQQFKSALPNEDWWMAETRCLSNLKKIQTLL